jgi:hypothetical protein
VILLTGRVWTEGPSTTCTESLSGFTWLNQYQIGYSKPLITGSWSDTIFSNQHKNARAPRLSFGEGEEATGSQVSNCHLGQVERGSPNYPSLSQSWSHEDRRCKEFINVVWSTSGLTQFRRLYFVGRIEYLQFKAQVVSALNRMSPCSYWRACDVFHS